MGRQIVIDFSSAPNLKEIGFRIWIFGEDLYRACRENEWASISLEGVDKATTRFRVTVHSKRRVKRTQEMIQKLLEKSHFTDVAKVWVEVTE